MIVGLVFPTKGRVELFGTPADDPMIRRRIGFMSENPYFYHYLTAREFMHFAGALLDLPGATTKERSKQLLKIVGLSAAADKQIRTFSKGMVQRLGFAQALVGDPDLVLLDEPLDGLDPLGRNDFKEIINDLKGRGKTVFFNSHILSDVQDLCDSIGIINQGKLVESGPLKKLLKKGETLEEHFVRILAPKRRKQSSYAKASEDR